MACLCFRLMVISTFHGVSISSGYSLPTPQPDPHPHSLIFYMRHAFSITIPFFFFSFLLLLLLLLLVTPSFYGYYVTVISYSVRSYLCPKLMHISHYSTFIYTITYISIDLLHKTKLITLLCY